MNRIYFYLLLLLLFLPALQQGLQLVAERPLGGTGVKIALKKINLNNWLSANYQNSTDAYLRQQTGFRNTLIRLNNQINYWLFGEIKTVNIVMGKEGYLFDMGYLHAYHGNDFIGDTLIEKRVEQLQLVHDTLAQLGTKILVIFAPSKAAFYPEHFPNRYLQTRTVSNYDFYKKTIAKTDIPTIDFNEWFIALKDTISYPLFPKTGIHWSEYSIALTADSLLKKVAQLTAMNVPNFTVDSLEWTTELRGTDRDIEDAMNLLFDLENQPMAYAKTTWQLEGEKPKIISIGDSFYWGWHNLGVPQKSFMEAEFWYYNRTIHPRPNDKGTNPKSYNYRKKLPEQDLIILIATEPSLVHFPWKFIELAHAAFFADDYLDEKDEVFLAKVYAMEDRIKKNKQWLADVTRKAKERGISVEQAIRVDAVYMLKQK